MLLSEQSLTDGVVNFIGSLNVSLGSENHPVDLVLEYPRGFPYVHPSVTPLERGLATENRKARLFSLRHQMANGALCLYERAPSDDPRVHLTGVQALHRARRWLTHALRGSLPTVLDSVESDLEAHYHRVGDVLMGPTAFGDHGDHGELVLVPFMPRSEQYPIFMVSHIRGQDNWHNDGEVLSRAGAQRPAAYWTGEVPENAPQVKWFSLKREPSPIRTIAELAGLLYPDEADPVQRFRKDRALELARAHALYVPIRYPGRTAGACEWLVVSIPLRDERIPPVRVAGLSHPGQVLDLSGPDVLESATIQALHVQDLRPLTLHVRNARRVPALASTLSLGIAGAGSLGSACADLLAKAGVGTLRIVDPGVLNAHNAVRHLAGVQWAGMPKAGLVALLCRSHNPNCEITHVMGSVVDLPSQDPFWNCRGVLSTIADDQVELALNRDAVTNGTTVYYLRALRSGSAGRLVRVRPGLDACFACLGLYHAERHAHAIMVPAAEDEVITRECGQPVLAASAADLGIVAGLGVRQLLADYFATKEINQWVWTTEGIPEHPKLAAPFSRATTQLPPHPKCSVCIRPSARTARVPSTVAEDMTRLAQLHAPHETGGILVGRRAGEIIQVLGASEAGPNAQSGPTSFERDGVFTQQYLERFAEEHGPGVDYVGEWHTHPGGSPQPSARDAASFAEIAADTKVLTTEPLLIIVAPSVADPRCEWSASVFPRDRLAYGVALDFEAAQYPAASEPPQAESIVAAAAAPSGATT